MLVAGLFERGPAAKSTRAELHGDECDEYFEKCLRHLEAHSRDVDDVHGQINCVTCEIVSQPLHPELPEVSRVFLRSLRLCEHGQVPTNC